jgi:hypothetical protein
MQQAASATSRVWINYKAGHKASAKAAVEATKAVIHHDRTAEATPA